MLEILFSFMKAEGIVKCYTTNRVALWSVFCLKAVYRWWAWPPLVSMFCRDNDSITVWSVWHHEQLPGEVHALALCVRVGGMQCITTYHSFVEKCLQSRPQVQRKKFSWKKNFFLTFCSYFIDSSSLPICESCGSY